MSEAELAARLAELEQRQKSNRRRIDELEKNTELLHRMVTSLEVLATRQEHMAEQVVRIDRKLSTLEQAPARRWHELIGYGIASLISAAVTYFGTALWG